MMQLHGESEGVPEIIEPTGEPPTHENGEAGLSPAQKAAATKRARRDGQRPNYPILDWVEVELQNAAYFERLLPRGGRSLAEGVERVIEGIRRWKTPEGGAR